MRSAESVAGVIGSVFGRPQREALHGDLMRSVGIGLAHRHMGEVDGDLMGILQQLKEVFQDQLQAKNGLL